MKNDFYLKLAEEVSRNSKCLRGNWGAVIVKNDMIIGVGYNGPARGVKHCSPCRRASLPPGKGYEKCIAAHAEVNAIIQSGGRQGCLGSIMYVGSHNRKLKYKYNSTLGFFPCDLCFRYIINAGIEMIVMRGKKDSIKRTLVSDAVTMWNEKLWRS